MLHVPDNFRKVSEHLHFDRGLYRDPPTAGVTLQALVASTAVAGIAPSSAEGANVRTADVVPAFARKEKMMSRTTLEERLVEMKQKQLKKEQEEKDSKDATRPRSNSWMVKKKKVETFDKSEDKTAKIMVFISWFLIIITMPFSLFFCLQVIKEYERAVMFRLGRLLPGGPKGPGIFFVLPCLDKIRKEVSVTNVSDVRFSTKLLAQTTLRNVLGTKSLAEMLSERDMIKAAMKRMLDEGTSPWGVKVERVEMKDIRLPSALMRSMAAEAEASRVARARMVLAEGEQMASGALRRAADMIERSPQALKLRYFMTLKDIAAEHRSTIIYPIAMNISALMGNSENSTDFWENYSNISESRKSSHIFQSGSSNNSPSPPPAPMLSSQQTTQSSDNNTIIQLDDVMGSGTAPRGRDKGRDVRGRSSTTSTGQWTPDDTFSTDSAVFGSSSRTTPQVQLPPPLPTTTATLDGWGQHSLMSPEHINHHHNVLVELVDEERKQSDESDRQAGRRQNVAPSHDGSLPAPSVAAARPAQVDSPEHRARRSTLVTQRGRGSSGGSPVTPTHELSRTSPYYSAESDQDDEQGNLIKFSMEDK